MTISKEVLSKFVEKGNIFIETGTWQGFTTALAFKIGFKKIFTIELSNKYYQDALKKFSKIKNIVCINGDSIDILPMLLKNINEKVVFWLDGHYSGEGTAKGVFEVPLFQELDAISKHQIKNHTILIDVVRLMNSSDWKNISIEDIKNKILQINPEYQFYFEDGHVKNDILVAQTK